MRESVGSSVTPTASESMLNPRRANSDDTRVSTPGLFSTRTESVCFIYSHTSSRSSSSSISDTGPPGMPPSISSIEPPGATIGNTHSSPATRKSTNAGPSWSNAWVSASSTSPGFVDPQAEPPVGLGELHEVGYLLGEHR